MATDQRKQWEQARETVKDPAQPRQLEGNVEEPKHVVAEPLPVVGAGAGGVTER